MEVNHLLKDRSLGSSIISKWMLRRVWREVNGLELEHDFGSFWHCNELSGSR